MLIKDKENETYIGSAIIGSHPSYFNGKNQCLGNNSRVSKKRKSIWGKGVVSCPFYKKIPVNIISAIEFDKTGNHLATGDRGGRVVLFERTDTKDHGVNR